MVNEFQINTEVYKWHACICIDACIIADLWNSEHILRSSKTFIRHSNTSSKLFYRWWNTSRWRCCYYKRPYQSSWCMVFKHNTKTASLSKHWTQNINIFSVLCIFEWKNCIHLTYAVYCKAIFSYIQYLNYISRKSKIDQSGCIKY